MVRRPLTGDPPHTHRRHCVLPPSTAFDSVCKAGGKEFAPIKLELKPAKESESGDAPNTQSGGNNGANTQQEDDGGNGAASSALSMGVLAGAFGIAMAAFAL